MERSTQSVAAGYYKLSQRLVGKAGVYRHMARVVNPRPGLRVLDIGCGTGELLLFLPGVSYVGVDYNAGFIAAARKRFGSAGVFCVGNVEALDPAVMSHADVVVALGVLHHLDDGAVGKLCMIARQVLQPSGRLVTLDPAIVPGRSVLDRLLTSLDRGNHVRTPPSYRVLIEPHFTSIRESLRNDLVFFRQTLAIFEAGASYEGEFRQ